MLFLLHIPFCFFNLYFFCYVSLLCLFFSLFLKLSLFSKGERGGEREREERRRGRGRGRGKGEGEGEREKVRVRVREGQRGRERERE